MEVDVDNTLVGVALGQPQNDAIAQIADMSDG
jgi:hypothetical protein